MKTGECRHCGECFPLARYGRARIAIKRELAGSGLIRANAIVLLPAASWRRKHGEHALGRLF
jgi:hypothetical protein